MGQSLIYNLRISKASLNWIFSLLGNPFWLLLLVIVIHLNMQLARQKISHVIYAAYTEITFVLYAQTNLAKRSIKHLSKPWIKPPLLSWRPLRFSFTAAAASSCSCSFSLFQATGYTFGFNFAKAYSTRTAPHIVAAMLALLNAYDESRVESELRDNLIQLLFHSISHSWLHSVYNSIFYISVFIHLFKSVFYLNVKFNLLILVLENSKFLIQSHWGFFSVKFLVYIKLVNFVALDQNALYAVVLIRMQNFKFTSLRLRCIFGGSCKNRCHLQQLVDKVCSANYPCGVQKRERER